MRKWLLPFLMMITLVINLISNWSELTHRSWAEASGNLAMTFVVLSVALGLFEVFKSKNIHIIEKLMWTSAFLFFTSLGFILYVIIGRRKVIGTKLEASYKYNLTN